MTVEQAGAQMAYDVLASGLAVYTCGLIFGLFIRLTNRS